MSLDTRHADPTSGHLSSPDRTHQPLASGSRWLALSGPPVAVLAVVVGFLNRAQFEHHYGAVFPGARTTILYRARGLCWDASSTDRLAGAEP